MKRLFCALACVAAVQAAQANSISTETFTGLYVGGAFGLTSAHFDVSPNYIIPDPLTFEENKQADVNALSAAGLLSLSYLYQFNNRFVVGAEFIAGYADAEADHNMVFNENVASTVNIVISNNIKMRLTNDFALLFKPGYVLHPGTLLYGTIGPRWGNFKTTLSDSLFLDSGPGSNISASGQSEVSGYELGLTVGAGIQQVVAEHLHLALEYAYTSYREIDAPTVFAEILASGTPLGEFTSDSPTIEASTNTVMLELSYQW